MVQQANHRKNYNKQMHISLGETQLHLRSTRGRLHGKCYVDSNQKYEMDHAVACRHGSPRVPAVEGASCVPAGDMARPSLCLMNRFLGNTLNNSHTHRFRSTRVAIGP